MIVSDNKLSQNQQEYRKVVMSAWKNYCRTSWIYRILEFVGLR